MSADGMTILAMDSLGSKLIIKGGSRIDVTPIKHVAQIAVPVGQRHEQTVNCDRVTNHDSKTLSGRRMNTLHTQCDR